MTGMIAYGEEGSVIFNTESSSPIFLGKATVVGYSNFDDHHQYQGYYGVYTPKIRAVTYTFQAPNSGAVIPFVKTPGFCCIQVCQRQANNVWGIKIFTEVWVGADIPEIYCFGPPVNADIEEGSAGLVVYDRNGKVNFSTEQRHIKPIGLGTVLSGPNTGGGSDYRYGSFAVPWGRQESWTAPMFSNPNGIPLVFMNSTEMSQVKTGAIQYYHVAYLRSVRAFNGQIEVRWGEPQSSYILPYDWGNFYGGSQYCNVIVLDSADYD